MNKLQLLYVKKSALTYKIKLKNFGKKIKLLGLIYNDIKIHRKNYPKINLSDDNLLRISSVCVRKSSDNLIKTLLARKSLNIQDNNFIINNINDSLPKKLNFQPRYIFSEQDESVNSIVFCNKIENLCSIYIEAEYKSYANSIYGFVEKGTRTFCYSYEINYKDINCYYYTYYIPETQSKINSNQTRTRIKFLIVTILLTLIWIILMFMITGIYTNYGKNIFSVVIMPLITTLFFNLFITSNIMTFISTCLMFYMGRAVYNIKTLNLTKIIFNALVPITAINSHQSIIMYRSIMEKLSIPSN